MRPFGKITLLWRISQEIFRRDLLPFAAKTRTFLTAPPTKCDVAHDFLPSQRTFLAHAPSFLFVPLNRAPKVVDFCAKHGCFSRKPHCFFAKLVHFLTDQANHERKGKTSPRKGGRRRAKLTEGGRTSGHFAFRRRTSRPTSCPRFCQVPFVLERTTAKTADENAESRRRCWGARPKFVFLREE